jgi:hypothetical protein
VNDKIQTTGLKRNTIDKYYTSHNVVDMCIDSMKTHLDIDKKKDLCIEPSAGNGSFIQKIKSTFKNNTFYDIEPENSNIIKMDYLDFDYDRDIHKNIGKFMWLGIHLLDDNPRWQLSLSKPRRNMQTVFHLYCRRVSRRIV